VVVLDWWRARRAELSAFAVVGIAGVGVNAAVYNVLLLGPLGAAEKVATAKAIATAVSVLFAWVAHRVWTFRASRSHRPTRELLLFLAVNVVGFVMEPASVYVSHHILGYTSRLADNVAAFGVGLPIGTVVRYLGYRAFVFTKVPPESVEDSAEVGDAAA